MRKRMLAGTALICNAAVVLSTVYALAVAIGWTTDGFMQAAGLTCLRYFTYDSNILCALSSLLALPACWAAVRGKPLKLSRGVLLFRYAGTAAVTVTLITVLFFLGPTIGYRAMFVGTSIWLHGISPVLAILSLVFIEAQGELKERDCWLAVLPVALYSCVYLTMVVFSDTWPDFYGFNAGGRWFISAPIMIVGTLLIGLGLISLQKLGKKEK